MKDIHSQTQLAQFYRSYS